ncbi:hypothetical protein BGW41_004585 [Actinomortierella wolfii]|nr:hypothetical protein BGW41_004585 [Actinomortierella wolfii]
MGATSTTRTRLKTAGSTRPSKAPRAVAKRATPRPTRMSQAATSSSSTTSTTTTSRGNNINLSLDRAKPNPNVNMEARASTSTAATKPSANRESDSTTKPNRPPPTRRRQNWPSSSDDHNLSGTSEESDRDSDESMESQSEDELIVGTRGLQPTLRVVSKATVQKKWKPLTVKTRTHVQSLITGLFPEVIARVRGENKKIAMQMQLNRLIQKINDRLSGLTVPPLPRNQRTPYAQLAARNRELEAMLLPDLEHIGELELRLEQEKKLAEQVEAQLATFQEKKQAFDVHTRQLYRSKLHRSLRGPQLESIMTSLAAEDSSYEHLGAEDQQLVLAMPEVQSKVAISSSNHQLYDTQSSKVFPRRLYQSWKLWIEMLRNWTPCYKP